MLRYDDIWLFQLIAINERANLLKFGKNYITTFKEILAKDWNVRKLYDEFINSEGAEKDLVKLMNYLCKKYSDDFSFKFFSISSEKEEYLADIVRFLGAVES